MLEIAQDISGYPNGDGGQPRTLRRPPAASRRRGTAATVLPALPPPMALCDANAKPLGLLDRVRIGGPNPHHGAVEIRAFSLREGRSILHYGDGFPNAASYWCYCAECVKED